MVHRRQVGHAGSLGGVPDAGQGGRDRRWPAGEGEVDQVYTEVHGGCPFAVCVQEGSGAAAGDEVGARPATAGPRPPCRRRLVLDAFGLRLAKYRPVTPSTSGEDAR